MEPRYNERLYNKVLDTTNDFLYPNKTDKIYEKKPRYIAIKFCQPLGRLLNRVSIVCVLDKYRSFLSRKVRMDGQLYLVLLIKRSQIWIDPVRRSIINFIKSEKSLFITFLLWTTFCWWQWSFYERKYRESSTTIFGVVYFGECDSLCFLFSFFTFTFVANKYHWHRLSATAF